MDYDMRDLDRLGKQRLRLRESLAEVEAALAAEVPRARAAGVTKSRITRATGYAESWIDKLVARAANGAAQDQP